MKRKVTVLLITVFLCIRVLSNANWKTSELNTAASANYLSSFEKEIIFEINKLRSNPSKYASDYLVPLQNRYKRNFLYYPGDKPLKTKEGVKALKECINELKRHKTMPIVFPRKGLHLSARDHVIDQSQSGRTGHLGGDRSRIKDRIERYGVWKTRIAENIAYGGISAQQVVIYLLIDDGIRDRGHRKNLLDPDFNFIGVATGSHPEYKNMCVMNFAGLYKNR